MTPVTQQSYLNTKGEKTIIIMLADDDADETEDANTHLQHWREILFSI
jgi:hypothetical protein